MNEWLTLPVDQIDAALFSGDALFDHQDRAEFKEVLDRWQRRVAEVDAIFDGDPK